MICVDGISCVNTKGEIQRALAIETTDWRGVRNVCQRSEIERPYSVYVRLWSSTLLGTYYTIYVRQIAVLLNWDVCGVSLCIVCMRLTAV